MNALTQINGRCGYVALIGRPNVGKSTLLNRLLGCKLSITSSKPQTTRHRLLGIKTVAPHQILYVDTPGLHRGSQQRALNRYMNRTVSTVLETVDVIVLLVESLRWQPEDDYILERLRNKSVPVILCINKIDQLKQRRLLLPYLQELASKMAFADIFPLSALNGENIPELEQKIISLLPENPPLFPEDQLTDRSERFLAAEFIREKLMRLLGEELPYRLSVEIEQFKEEENLLRIDAIIWVEKPGQKVIVIGKEGQVLKRVGTEARQNMESLFQRKVFLQLWVKVKPDWSNDEKALYQLGYREN